MSSVTKTALSRASTSLRSTLLSSPRLQARGAQSQRSLSDTPRCHASDEQAIPLGRYYDILLTDPPPYLSHKPEEPPLSSAPDKTSSQATAPAPQAAETTLSTPSPPTSTPPPASPEEKACIVFGSSLAGPMERAERLAAIRAHTRVVAGVRLPPKPEEPDNCCMSGCVNCVWERFREEMEEWATAAAEVERRLKAPGGPDAPQQQQQPVVSAGVVDDNGGASETNLDVGKAAETKMAKDLWNEELYRDVPVGIREFMKQERKLKEKHKQQGTTGG